MVRGWGVRGCGVGGKGVWGGVGTGVVVVGRMVTEAYLYRAGWTCCCVDISRAHLPDTRAAKTS